MPMEYAPEARDDKPAGTPQAETVNGNVAPLYCTCGARWRFDTGYWVCDTPELPGHDVASAPPTVTGLIPCQPVNPWHPAEHPGMARQQLAAQITEELVEERRIL